jgi:hypothetical protein
MRRVDGETDITAPSCVHFSRFVRRMRKSLLYVGVLEYILKLDDIKEEAPQ